MNKLFLVYRAHDRLPLCHEVTEEKALERAVYYAKKQQTDVGVKDEHSGPQLHTVCYDDFLNEVYVYHGRVLPKKTSHPTKLWKNCPGCGKQFKPDWNHCPKCGLKREFFVEASSCCKPNTKG